MESSSLNRFEKRIGSGQVITFRPFEIKEDLVRLHEWMHKDHVIPFWQLNVPFSRLKRHMEKAVANEHQLLWIGCLDDVPLSYWETYEVKEDVIGKYYRYHSQDRGIHLLIGPEFYIGRGLAEPFVKAMVDFEFTKRKATKIVAEPDITNKKMIHVFQKCGFQPIKPITLPEKRALLMIYHRHHWKGRGL
ncbi:GNAT family N-acetyltransferase [Bacillus sp. FJAT-44742]|uniref:GNAT family N-acetyltransferase n=1 Tax=Bacillus sp. FJAT-44742 TaxID=2014005 RepID=UPI000C23FC20|nr:GNAT family N-acetyltransferase [Bacillus sp. FJAT-44742]